MGAAMTALRVVRGAFAGFGSVVERSQPNSTAARSD
jgi:hypothetical protein